MTFCEFAAPRVFSADLGAEGIGAPGLNTYAIITSDRIFGTHRLRAQDLNLRQGC